MKLSIPKFSVAKARRAVINSAKIEGHIPTRNKKIQSKARRLALKLYS